MENTCSTDTAVTKTSFLVQPRTISNRNFFSKRFVRLLIEIILVLSAILTCSEAYRVVQLCAAYTKQVKEKYKSVVELGRALALIFFAFTSTLTLLAYVIYRCIKESGIFCPLLFMTATDVFLLIKVHEARGYILHSDRNTNDEMKVKSIINELNVHIWIGVISHFILLILTVTVISWPQHERKLQRKVGTWVEDFLKTKFQSHLPSGLLDDKDLSLHIRNAILDLKCIIKNLFSSDKYVESISNHADNDSPNDKLRLFTHSQLNIYFGGQSRS